MAEVAYPSRSRTLYDLKELVLLFHIFHPKKHLPSFIGETLSHIANLEHSAKRIEKDVTETTRQLEGLLLKGRE